MYIYQYYNINKTASLKIKDFFQTKIIWGIEGIHKAVCFSLDLKLDRVQLRYLILFRDFHEIRTEYSFPMKSFNIMNTAQVHTFKNTKKNVSLPVVHEFFLSKLPFCLRALVCRVIIGHVSLMQPGSRKALFRMNGTNRFLSLSNFRVSNFDSVLTTEYWMNIIDTLNKPFQAIGFVGEYFYVICLCVW